MTDLLIGLFLLGGIAFCGLGWWWCALACAIIGAAIHFGGCA